MNIDITANKKEIAALAIDQSKTPLSQIVLNTYLEDEVSNCQGARYKF